MRYKDILSQAYSLTIHNPQLWLFGLVMLGGFNLSFVNFLALMTNERWETWPIFLGSLFSSGSIGVPALVLATGILFVVFNFVKILFLVVIHNLIHATSNDECDLCVKSKHHPLPYMYWLGEVMIASALTVTLTVGITLAVNAVVAQGGYDRGATVIINLIFIAVMTCIIGTWNAFTSYFIIFHGLRFQKASQSAMDLMIMRFRRIIEFLVILSAIYTVAVFVGNSFVHTWHHGFAGYEIIHLKLAALLAFAVWTAINNSFFNISFVLFFDNLVHSKPVREKSEAVLPAP